MNPGRKPSYFHLLKDAEVKRWYENVRRGSKITADVYLRRLGGLCIRNNTTPAGLARLGNADATRLLLDQVSKLESEGYAGSYIESIVKATRSWLTHNQIALTVKIKVAGADDTPTLVNERTPTSQELAGILLYSVNKELFELVLRQSLDAKLFQVHAFLPEISAKKS